MLEFNLLPWREQLKRETQVKQLLEAFAAALLGALLCWILNFIFNWQLETVKARLLQIQNGLIRVNQNLQALHQAYQDLDYQKLPDFDLSMIFHHQEHILNFLSRIANLQPKDLYARQISLDGRVWKMEGVSADLGKILRFSEILKSGLSGENLSIQRKKGVLHYQLRLESSV